MEVGTLLVLIALALAIISFFRPEPLLTVAVILVAVALLTGEPIDLST